MEEIKTGKEGLALNRQEHYKNLCREVEQTQKQIDSIKEMKGMLEVEKSLSKKNFELAFEAFKMINPNWEFEKNPEYMENVKKMNAISARRKEMQLEMELGRIDNSLETVQQQLDSLTKERDRVQETLEKGD